MFSRRQRRQSYLDLKGAGNLARSAGLYVPFILRLAPSVSLLNALRVILTRHRPIPVRRNLVRENDMRFDSEHCASAALSEKLRAAVDVTPELMTEVLDVTCRRVFLQSNAAKALRLNQLIDAGAWTDAALALLELELPFWHIRRIAYDSGEWHCALSRQCELPDWLDQAVESRHANLMLAILSAFVEAQGTVAATSRTSVPSVFRDQGAACNIPMCCNAARAPRPASARVGELVNVMALASAITTQVIKSLTRIIRSASVIALCQRSPSSLAYTNMCRMVHYD